jgi:hypothetical protein
MAKRWAWIAIAGLAASTLALAPPVRAQSETLGPPPSAGGPTREAQTATARAYLDTEPASPHFMPRYLAFQRDFAHDFGVLGPRVTDRVDALLGLKARLEQRWGDTALYEWLERGLAIYAQIQASTRTEGRGFDVRMETDDVAQGKLGVRMSRPFGAASTE